MKFTLAGLLAGLAAFVSAQPSPVKAQASITCGVNTLLPNPDGQAIGLILAQPCVLTQQAMIQSLSFYTTNHSGNLTMGLYSSSGPNGGPGAPLAVTRSVAAKAHNWNTTPVITQVTLMPGNYWLAWEPSSNNLDYLTGGGQSVYADKTYGSLPNPFPPIAGSWTVWSFYATLLPTAPPPPTLSVSFNPPSPSIPASSPAGTIVAQIVPAWSNGAPFTGTVAFGQPNGSDGGTFAIDGNLNVIVSSSGSGVGGDGGTVQNVTITANQ